MITIIEGRRVTVIEGRLGRVLLASSLSVPDGLHLIRFAPNVAWATPREILGLADLEW